MADDPLCADRVEEGAGPRPDRGERVATDASTTAVPGAQPPRVDGQRADRLAVFGITGDLARVMTFRSLYRLEKRGLLDCPILGVAVDDWSLDQLKERARDSIVGTGEELDEQVFKRLADRLSYIAGDFSDAATYEAVAEAISGATSPVFYLEIPPFLFGTVVKGLADAGLADSARAEARSLPKGFSTTTRAPPVRPAPARPLITVPNRNGGISR